MRTRGRLSTKFLILGITLLVLALVSIGLTMWVTRQLEGGAAAVNEAGRLRMQAWRLASAVQGGQTPQAVQGLLQEFDATVHLLRQGDPQRPLFVPWTPETHRHFEALHAAWLALRPVWATHQPVTDPQLLTQRVEAFVEQVSQLVMSIEKTMARFTAVLNLFQFLMMALAIAAAVFSLYVGYLFVIYPLQRLHQGLQQIEKGDFSARVVAESPDEFGDLAAGFNHMAQTLQNLYQGLERKVAEKTHDLEAERARLAALYEVSSFLVQAHALEPLAHGFAQKIRRFSGAAAAVVRWSDQGSQRYLLLASDCLPEALVQEERCIQTLQCACGQPPETAQTRVIPIVPEGGKHLGGCARVGYTTLVSVPIRWQGQVLGEIDLLYAHDVALTQEERGLYDTLAGHLAHAVENLRTEALLREAAVSKERTMIAAELHDSIAQSLAFLKIQVSLLRQALHKGDVPRTVGVIDELEAGIRESTSDVRELLVHFRTRTDSADIEHALQTTLQKFEHQTGLKTQLVLQGHGVPLPSDVQLQVLHVVQEALSNVRKHAAATQVKISVDCDPHWCFSVSDDGRGFAPTAASASDTHVGLHIMRERAERIGATVQVTSQPGHGTVVRIELPPSALQVSSGVLPV